MSKRGNPTLLRYYQWSPSEWMGSQTRLRLSLPERAVFRECLDLCYLYGGFPDDFELLARMLACSRPEVEATWPKIQHHFQRDPKRSGVRKNKRADVFRKQYVKYCLEQAQKRLGKGSRQAAQNEQDTEQVKNSGSTVEKPISSQVNQSKERKSKVKSAQRAREGSGDPGESSREQASSAAPETEHAPDPAFPLSGDDDDPLLSPRVRLSTRLRRRHGAHCDPERIIATVEGEIRGRATLTDFLDLDRGQTTSPDSISNPGGYYRDLARKLAGNRVMPSVGAVMDSLIACGCHGSGKVGDSYCDCALGRGRKDAEETIRRKAATPTSEELVQ